MIQYGLGLIGLAIMMFGIIHAHVARGISVYHDGIAIDPLLAPRTWVERYHMKRKCVECSFHAELRSTMRG